MKKAPLPRTLTKTPLFSNSPESVLDEKKSAVASVVVRKRKIMKKAQLQSTETIIIVIMLILLALIGLWFFAQATTNRIESTKDELKIESLQSIGKQLSYLPELSCESGGAETELCIDIVKANILSKWLADPDKPYHDQLRLSYYQLFGDTRISLLQLYPAVYPAEDKILLFNGTSALSVFAQALPISLYDPVDGTNSLGILYAETE